MFTVHVFFNVYFELECRWLSFYSIFSYCHDLNFSSVIDFITKNFIYLMIIVYDSVCTNIHIVQILARCKMPKNLYNKLRY